MFEPASETTADSDQPTSTVRNPFLGVPLSERDAARHTVQMVTLSSDQIKILIALGQTFDIQNLVKLDFSKALGYNSDESGKLNAEDKRIARVARNIQTSAKSIVSFARMLEQKPISPQGIRLPSDELPTAWREDFSTARRLALSHIKDHTPELHEKVKTSAGLKRALQNPDDCPHAVIDSVMLLGELEKVRGVLDTCLPTTQQLQKAQTSPLVTLTQEEVQALRRLKFDELVTKVQDDMPEIPMDNGIILTEEFMHSLRNATGSKRLERHLVPQSQDAKAYLLAAREAVVQSIIEKHRDLVREIVTKVEGVDTITAADIGKTFLAGQWGSMAEDKQVRKYLTNLEYYDPKHTAIGRILPTHFESVHEQLVACMQMDMALAQLTEALDKVNGRLDTLKMAPAHSNSR